MTGQRDILKLNSKFFKTESEVIKTMKSILIFNDYRSVLKLNENSSKIFLEFLCTKSVRKRKMSDNIRKTETIAKQDGLPLVTEDFNK